VRGGGEDYSRGRVLHGLKKVGLQEICRLLDEPAGRGGGGVKGVIVADVEIGRGGKRGKGQSETYQVKLNSIKRGASISEGNGVTSRKGRIKKLKLTQF